jgi:hypothetical protein
MKAELTIFDHGRAKERRGSVSVYAGFGGTL